MSQFYIETEGDLRRCRASLMARKPLSITAFEDDVPRLFKGTVQSIQEDRDQSPPRWLVTITED